MLQDATSSTSGFLRTENRAITAINAPDTGTDVARARSLIHQLGASDHRILR